VAITINIFQFVRLWLWMPKHYFYEAYLRVCIDTAVTSLK
jgi:hypothetical protein